MTRPPLPPPQPTPWPNPVPPPNQRANAATLLGYDYRPPGTGRTLPLDPPVGAETPGLVAPTRLRDRVGATPAEVTRHRVNVRRRVRLMRQLNDRCESGARS